MDKMIKLIAYGDSFTWGSDMGDTLLAHEYEAKSEIWKIHNPFNDTYSRNTWQALLAREKGMEYICLAEQGCSNQSILRRFFETAHLIQSDDIVSVNFTWRSRYDFFDKDTQQWETVRPSGTEDSKYYEMYFKYIQSGKWEIIESLKAINLIIDYLKMNNINFIATCIDDLIYKDAHRVTQFITQLQNIHKDDIMWFNGTGFHEWSKINNYKISQMWHPLEEAHEAAYAYILENWNIDEIT